MNRIKRQKLRLLFFTVIFAIEIGRTSHGIGVQEKLTKHNCVISKFITKSLPMIFTKLVNQ